MVIYRINNFERISKVNKCIVCTTDCIYTGGHTNRKHRFDIFYTKKYVSMYISSIQFGSNINDVCIECINTRRLTVNFNCKVSFRPYF